MDKPIAWMYKTEVCNRLEETEFSKDSGERRWREKVLEIVPLYAEPEIRTYWWILDEWGVLNFFDKREDFLHARKHIDGLDESSTTCCDSFEARFVADCWKTEDVIKWKNGILETE